MEQRVNMKFSYNLKKTAAETHEMLLQAYGEEAVSKKCAYEWFKRFRDGKKAVEDEPKMSHALVGPRHAELPT